MSAVDRRYVEAFRQMQHWSERQSWSQESLVKAMEVLLGEVKDSKYNEEIKALKELKNKNDLKETLEGLHEVVDKF